MIHFMSEKRAAELENSQTGDGDEESADLKFSLSNGLLAPSDALKEFWDGAEHSVASWSAVAEAYKGALLCDEGQAGLALLAFYAKHNKKVWVTCECDDPKWCIRQLVAEALIAKGIETFVE